MRLDIESVPFGCYGSHIAFSKIKFGPVYFQGHLGLRSLYGFSHNQETYPLILLDENENWIRPEIEMTASEIIASSGDMQFKMCFHDANTVHIIANTALMIAKTELTGFLSDRVMLHESGIWEIAGNDGSIRIRLLKGEADDRSGWRQTGTVCEKIETVIKPDESGQLDIYLWYQGISAKEPDYCSYEQDLAERRSEFAAFRSNFISDVPKYEVTMELAAYISWHSVIAPEGYVTAPVMLMSKNIMNMVWSWDYTFNALALVDKAPELAYAQFAVMADMQDSDGAYPDAFHARLAVRTFVKPPVQGFILDKMYKIQLPDTEMRRRIYHSVADFTRWWLNFRTGRDGIPVYNHGNESGWDNGTVFGSGLPVKSPDLSTWLILQMEFLAREAAELGLRYDSFTWKQHSEEMLKNLLSVLADDERFFALKLPENTIVETDSLLLFIPLLLGKKLPASLRNVMMDKLLAPDKYLTEYGLASEPLDSRFFVEDGYWRGAVWPPTAYIFTELLMINGKKEHALKNAAAYCDMCTTQGFFENYSALDGHGLRDCGFTWAASAFMILLRDYLHGNNL